jgi:hypothetical protein
VGKGFTLRVRASAPSTRRTVALAGVALALAGSAAACGNANADPKSEARNQLAARGWSSQFSCLDALWTRESDWRWNASNPSSGAYGIPQALPGSKMAANGADWRTNAATQIAWGLDYIGGRYGTPCGAWSHSQSYGWY